MNFKAMQTHQLLAALGACLAAMILAGPAAAKPDDGGGNSNRPVLEEQSVTWYLTDEYRPFMLPDEVDSANATIVNQRQLELAGDKQFQVVPYLSHGILEPEQAWEVIPYLSHGVLTASDAAGLAAQSNTPDGYQPQLGVSEFAVVADDGFDWTTTGFAASMIAALLVALAVTFTRGSRHGYRSA